MSNNSMDIIRRLGRSILSWECVVCKARVTEGDAFEDNLTFTRIGGNSANGYEAHHTSCLNAE